MAGSIIERLTGEGKEIDHYELLRAPPGTAKWGEIEFDHSLGPTKNLAEPLEEENVRNTAETEGWPSGTYKLQGRYGDGTMSGALWSFQHENPEDDQEEIDPEEERFRRLERKIDDMADDDRGPSITSVDEGFGAVFEQTLNGEIDDSERLDMLGDFLSTWKEETREPPSGPDEFVGALANMHLQAGNVEAATVLVDRWLQGDQQGTGGGSSILELATEHDLDIDTDTIKTLGMLKFLDDPRGMMQDMAAGAVEGTAGGGTGAQAGQQEADDGPNLVDLLDQTETEAAQEAQESVQEDGQADAEEAIEMADASAEEIVQEAGDVDEADGPATGADLDLVGVDDGGDVEPDDDGTTDDTASGETGTAGDSGRYTATCPDCNKTFEADTQEAADRKRNGHLGSCTGEGGDPVREVERELEEQTDREAGEYPAADEALKEMNEAANQDGEESEAES